MTTDIRVRTNGNYVAEGTLTITHGGVSDQPQEVKVGPGSMVEKAFYIPHTSQAVLQLTERDATEEEIAAVQQAAAKED